MVENQQEYEMGYLPSLSEALTFCQRSVLEVDDRIKSGVNVVLW